MEGLLNVSYSTEENWLFLLGLIQPLVLFIQLAWSYTRRETYAHVPSVITHICIYHWLLFAYVLQLFCAVAGALYVRVNEDFLCYSYFSYWILWFYYLIGVSMKVYELKRNEIPNN